LGEDRLRLLRQVERAHGEAVGPLVEVDDEVVRRDRVPVVVAVLDLVLAEVLRVRRTGQGQGHEAHRARQCPAARAPVATDAHLDRLSFLPGSAAPERPCPWYTGSGGGVPRPAVRLTLTMRQYSHRALRFTL